MDNKIFSDKLRNESGIVIKLLSTSKLRSAKQQLDVATRSRSLISKIRANKSFSMEEFLYRYSLSYDEGVAVLGLAEGLLRIPDNLVTKELVRDKLSDKNWGAFLFKKSTSFKTIFASFGLYFAGKFSDLVKLDNILSNLLDRIGQPLFIKALKVSILFLSKEFIFAEDVTTAISKTSKYPDCKFAFDLLGESARTIKQADTYYTQYHNAISIISNAFPYKGEALEERPNLSVKLTALYPRVELLKLEDLEKILLPKLVDLVEKIRDNNLTITFDAEEAHRNDVYLLLLTQLIEHPSFKKFEGIGLVVQAYQTRSYQIIEYIIALAKKSGKKIPLRLVKGAYWDTEIKRAQEIGMENYPVFTKKEYTDLSYIACAKVILENDKFIYPQFATHNAVTAASIIELAGDKKYEFQKLYGMGNTLHVELAKHRNIRIYAPIGNTKDLLAYLIRRMLENGASANFVSKVHSNELKISDMVYDVNDKALSLLDNKGKINLPKDIYPNRTNAMGYDLGYKANYDYIQEKVASYYDKVHKVGSIINGVEIISAKQEREVFCPGKNAEKFASISDAVEGEIKAAVDAAYMACEKWSNLPVQKRAQILKNIAQAFEDNKFELYALLIKESGKSIHDAINEVIEAIDFCRYYANQSELLMQEKILPGATGENNVLTMHGRGVFLCISPWNFPFAIFIGQIVAALAAGNTVIAKPSGQTTVVANFAVKLMHKIGVTKSALNLIITSGSNISKHVVSDERIAGVVFTGSCGAAKAINTILASRNSGIIPFIAETGGQNAMIVDSSALLEQVTDTVLTSAFYSAGQRCSALRMLYVQEEIYDELLKLIKEATELLEIGDTSKFNIDIGPVIDNNSKETLNAHINYMTQKGFKVAAHPHAGKQNDGHYFYPHIIEVKSINDIPDEKFGPILHITKYKANNLDKVINEINNCGFGLTFGVHSRIEDKIEYIRSKIKVGNFYANRSITGAKVESQPFGGENKSGTGFKAGGPNYLLRFMTERTTTINTTAFGGNIELLNS